MMKSPSSSVGIIESEGMRNGSKMKARSTQHHEGHRKEAARVVDRARLGEQRRVAPRGARRAPRAPARSSKLIDQPDDAGRPPRCRSSTALKSSVSEISSRTTAAMISTGSTV